MIRRLIKLQILILFLLAAVEALAQTPQLTAREKQWQNYQLPAEEFSRQSDAGKVLMFRIPASWKQEPGTQLSFAGPHSSFVKVFAEKVPDGVPLTDYVAALAQQIRNQPGADELQIRRTQMAGLEAREILLQVPEPSGEMSQRVIWCAVDGPTAISFVLITPATKVAETEPFFKAIVQSVKITTEGLFKAYEALRVAAIKETKPARIDEVQRLTIALNGFDAPARRASIDKLASVFATSPDAGIDLVLDRRAMVRAAAIEAIGLSRNTSLTEFLFTALEDKETFVAERAAKGIAAMPDVLVRLRSHSLDWTKSEPVTNIWGFLTADRRKEILHEIFDPTSRPGPPRREPKREPSPSPARGVRVLGNVTVKEPPSTVEFAKDPSVQLTGVALLRRVPVSEFQTPLAQMVAIKDDTLIRAALEVAITRNEKLAVEPLLKLLNSSNQELVKLAAEHLGNSGSAVDVPKIEARLSQLSKDQPQPSPNPASPKTEPGTSSALAVAIQKIRLREQIAASSGNERAEIIKKALSDPKIADWAWRNFLRDENSGTLPAGGSTQQSVTISSLAENALPANVTLYAALPNPSAALNRMSDAFNAIQMDTARQQADLVLLMNALRLQLAAQVNAEPGVPLTDYFGINGSAPAVFARWHAESAPAGIPSATRRAIFMRVSDRERFERLLGLFQRTTGDTAHLADYISGGVRFLGIMPGIFPMAAKMILDDKTEKPKDFTILRLGFSGTTQWNGYSIKTIEQEKIDSSGHVVTDTAYLTYFGDTALLTPDLDSLRDVLTRATSSKATLASNPEFKHAANSGGDAVYLCNLAELLAAPGDGGELSATESGSLKITNSVWENLFQLKFPASDWSKPLIRFKPEELLAPRELLPSTSFAYFITRIDPAAAWTGWGAALDAETQKTFKSEWAVDFERDVLPHLGQECGIVAAGVPDINGNDWNVPLLVFFQLKGEKLKQLFDQGTLFKSKSVKPNIVNIKIASTDVLATIRNGFLVFANTEAALATLDAKEKLAASPDFNKTLKRAPDNLVAFAGLNQDAGVDAITRSIDNPERQQQLSALLSIAKAFHSQTFYATAEATGIGARFSTLIGREGKYSVAELSSLAKDQVLTFAIIEARGVPISNQQQLKHLRLRMRTQAGGEADRLVADISSPTQSVNKKSDAELEVIVRPRRFAEGKKLQLPITDPAVAQYLQATREIRANDQNVIAKAKEIAGDDRDAWSVARKLGEWTFKNLKWKRVDLADAAQTLATREADCSEFSQLYVAMARSLGLPARMVSGLAHSGSSFGGHAWVEVYVGEWIELDPTFGTDFVDATHIKDASGGLLTYAALNLIELEVLEAPRGVADFQLEVKKLTAKLSSELAKGNSSSLTAALDLQLLTDRTMGKDSWGAMSDAEREQMSSAYRRIILEMIQAFKDSDDDPSSLRLLRVKEAGDSAEALLMQRSTAGEFLERLIFVKANGGWYLAEAIQADTGLHTVAELMQPVIRQIRDQRSGKTGKAKSTTGFVRVIVALGQDAKNAIAVADEVLKEEPNNLHVLHAKGRALAQDEQTIAQAAEIWKRLAANDPPYAAAVLKLADYFSESENKEERAQATALYEKYIALEPDDPRGHTRLASVYEYAKNTVQAEAEYRAAIAADLSNSDVYLDLAEFLATQKRYSETVTAIREAAKHASADEDVLGSLFLRLLISEAPDDAEALARLLPAMIETSLNANLNLARIRMNAGRAAQALPLLRRAADIDKKSSLPWSTMSECYRALKNWTAAFSAANTAIARNPEDGDGYYELACAQARLGRPRDAIASLKRAVELDPFLADAIEEEADLKSLAALAEFKKLLTEAKKK